MKSKRGFRYIHAYAILLAVTVGNLLWKFGYLWAHSWQMNRGDPQAHIIDGFADFICSETYTYIILVLISSMIIGLVTAELFVNRKELLTEPFSLIAMKTDND